MITHNYATGIKLKDAIKTRGNSLKLLVPNCKVNARAHCVSVGVIMVWNKLIDDNVYAPSISSFSNELFDYLKVLYCVRINLVIIVFRIIAVFVRGFNCFYSILFCKV